MTDQIVDGWRWMPLSERRSESPTYHDVLFPTPVGPIAGALDEWICKYARNPDHGVVRYQRINIIAGREVLGIQPHSGGKFGRINGADLLEVVDLFVHVLDEHIDDVDLQPGRQSGALGYALALEDLQQMLSESRSLWQIGRLPDQSLGLVQRVNDATVERARTVLSPETIAVSHLRKAWAELYRRESQPKASLDQSVYALESAMRAIVSPKNQRSTLGTMISNLEAKPSKWVVPIGTVEQLSQRLANIWRTQPRHGVDDENDLIVVEHAFADAALQEALTIVHWCDTGLFRRTDTA